MTWRLGWPREWMECVCVFCFWNFFFLSHSEKQRGRKVLHNQPVGKWKKSSLLFGKKLERIKESISTSHDLCRIKKLCIYVCTVLTCDWISFYLNCFWTNLRQEKAYCSRKGKGTDLGLEYVILSGALSIMIWATEYWDSTLSNSTFDEGLQRGDPILSSKNNSTSIFLSLVMYVHTVVVSARC